MIWLLSWAAAQPVADAWVAWPPQGSLHGARPVEGRRVSADGQVWQRVLVPGNALPELRNDTALRWVQLDHAMGTPQPGYRTPEAGTALLADLAAASSRASVVPVGRSVEGRPIDALVVGQAHGSGAPVFRVFGAHHGDEGASWEVALAVAAHLINGDGVDDRVTRILDQATVWIVPFVNPDGASRGNRLNANQVDLNRNYDFAWSPEETFGGAHPFSEPETRAMRAFGHLIQPVASLSLHSGAANFGWVWNHTETPAIDAPAMRDIALDYAARCTRPDFWITNGAAWYITYGDTNDWSYGRYGVYDFTLELTEFRTPLPSEIDAFVDDHLDATMDFLDRVPQLQGTVVDAVHGWPLMARIDASGTAPFYADPSTGTFHRLSVDADTITISAPGYASLTVPVDGEPVWAALQPEALASGRTQPWAVSTPTTVALPARVSGERITLVRPGADPLSLDVVDGHVPIDPATMAPGAWSLVDADGTVTANALWVTGSDHADVVARTYSDGTLELAGTALDETVAAWAFRDTARIPLPIERREYDRLVLDLEPAGAAPVEVGLWVGGAMIGISPATAEMPAPSGCGCNAQLGSMVVWAWLPILLVARRQTRSGRV